MNLARLAFLLIFARPLARFLTGADVIDRQRLPSVGPAIIAANHTSHVDTLLLLTIFPARVMSRVRPVAAADYFLKGPLISWFSRNLVGIVPIVRAGGGRGDVLAPIRQALAQGDIVIVFPEGTRGTPTDEIGPLKSGISRLAAAFPDAPVTPVWIEGAGRVLPKGAHVPAPLNCTVLVGKPLYGRDGRAALMEALRASLMDLKKKAPPQRWRDRQDADRPPTAGAADPSGR
ncbi:MAG: lysophospholipid acyltransferase family protein [Caulobacterales bacterium]